MEAEHEAWSLQNAEAGAGDAAYVGGDSAAVLAIRASKTRSLKSTAW